MRWQLDSHHARRHPDRGAADDLRQAERFGGTGTTGSVARGGAAAHFWGKLDADIGALRIVDEVPSVLG